MGRIVHYNNGKTTIFTTGEELLTNTGSTDTYYVGANLSDGTYTKVNPNGDIINLEEISSTTGFTKYIETTYSELYNLYDNSLLEPGYYYLITDFQTIYDQPDFYPDSYSGGYHSRTPITKTGNTEPLLVFAISNDKLSPDAYQPNYPKDKIKYDITWQYTEVNGIPTKGRITERIDEYNNRTDYDHRNVLFKRYNVYSFEEQSNGTIYSYDSNTGVLSGISTSFLTQLSIDNVLTISSKNSLGYDFGVRVSAITSDDTVITYIDNTLSTINFTDVNYEYFIGNPTGDYLSFKEYYIGQSNDNDYVEVYTFDLDGSCTNNYFGDYSNNHPLVNINTSEFVYLSDFILANNHFKSPVGSNEFGDGFTNNSFVSSYGNKIGSNSQCNILRNKGFENNEIGNSFSDNLIFASLNHNKILNNFGYNNIITSFFTYNSVREDFTQNTIYGNFRYNTIGTFFLNNRIGSNTKNYGNFEYNTIDTNFTNNFVSGIFKYNTIDIDFSNNVVGDKFGSLKEEPAGNNIGKFFKFNTIGESFGYNNVSSYFQNNLVLDDFVFNTVKYPVSGKNFSGATYVYGEYNCDIFSNSNNDLILSYYDSGNTLTIITDITT